MTIYSDVLNAVYEGTLKIFTNIGLGSTPIFYSHQNNAEPGSPHVVIQLVTMLPKGRTQEATLTDDGDVNGENKNLWYTVQYEVVIQFSFVGSTAPDLATEFQHAVNNNRVVIEAYQLNNLAPLRKSILRRAPEKRDTKWIEKFNMDVTFSYAVQTIQPIDWVEKVVLVDELSGESFTIPPTP